jgi:hypothetical protein
VTLLLTAGIAPIAALPLRTKFRKADWYVQTLHVDMARRMVEQYHYAKGASPNGVYLHGLFLHGDFINCYGVAWWIPAMAGTVMRYNPGGMRTTLAMHRLVVHPLVPTNGASFLLGGSIRAIARDGRYSTLVTYADTWRGHTGQIYKATNWHYECLSDPLDVWVTEGGAHKSRRDGLAGKNHTTLDELRGDGHAFVGKFPKHVYTMRLKLKPQPKQEELWTA